MSIHSTYEYNGTRAFTLDSKTDPSKAIVQTNNPEKAVQLPQHHADNAVYSNKLSKARLQAESKPAIAALSQITALEPNQKQPIHTPSPRESGQNPALLDAFNSAVSSADALQESPSDNIPGSYTQPVSFATYNTYNGNVNPEVQQLLSTTDIVGFQEDKAGDYFRHAAQFENTHGVILGLENSYGDNSAIFYNKCESSLLLTHPKSL